MEDEVVAMYAQGQLDDCVASCDRVFCPKTMQVSLTGFIGDATATFMGELQDLLLSAQKEPTGIPSQLV